MKELFFDHISKNTDINLPTDDLLLGGSKSIKKYINTNKKFIQFFNSKFTDIPFKSMGKSKFKSNNSSNIDLENLEMEI